jgi:SAM-dependent methyltransferase
MDDGWDQSADAWMQGMGEQGDWSRRVVLDPPMLDRIAGRGFAHALDIGCGEGRFCRLMRGLGIAPIGVDPTTAFIERAQSLDPAGDYRIGRAEALDVDSGTIDLAVSYLSLIDIADLKAALAEVHRVLRPGGTFLFANLQSFNTAGEPDGWRRDADGAWRFSIAGYLEERSQRIAWGDVSITNWHRPLSTYMGLLLQLGFELRHFAEPEPMGEPDAKSLRYRQAPYFLMMEWQKA